MIQVLPPAGSPTVFAKILSQSESRLEIEGLAGSVAELDVRFVHPLSQIAGAVLDHGKLLVRFRRAKATTERQFDLRTIKVTYGSFGA